MSDSKKIEIIILKKKQIHTIFCRENEKLGGRGDSGIFSRFLYISKDIFILIPYSIGSFLKYNETLFQFFCNFYNNLNFSENSEICIFFKKLNNLSLNFGLMLTKTSLIVFNLFLGQLGYIVMSDSEKNQNIYFLKKRRRFTPFFGREKWKNV